jgi:hypothetical protein
MIEDSLKTSEDFFGTMHRPGNPFRNAVPLDLHEMAGGGQGLIGF